MPTNLTVAAAILEQLRLWGVKRIYGVVGDAIFGLLDAISRQKEIVFISVKHESVASMMASAEAKLTGGLAVCIAQMGPGLVNLLNGLGDAYMDKAPVLAITGQAPLNKIGTPYKQFINQQEIIQAVSVFSQLVVHQDAIIPALTQAMNQSIVHKTVSHLSIPADLFRLTTTVLPNDPPHIYPTNLEKDKLHDAIELMTSAKRPLMLVGSNVSTNNESLQALAETWGCGIVMVYGAIGMIPHMHPLMLNGVGEGGNPINSIILEQADVLLAIETEGSEKLQIAQNAHVIQIASKRDSFDMILPVHAGLIGDAAVLAPLLTECLKFHAVNLSWIQQIKQSKQANALDFNIPPHHPTHLTPVDIIRTIEQSIDDDAIIALDEGDITLWFLRNFRAKRQKVLLSRRWRTMGFGLPAAMAAKLCCPQKQIICITGDGGLAMVLADLLTAKRYHLAVTVIVFQNDALQMEQDKMLLKGLHPEGTSITNPDFVQLAEACGWMSHAIGSLDQLQSMLQSANSGKREGCNVPVLLNVPTASIPYPEFQTT